MSSFRRWIPLTAVLLFGAISASAQTGADLFAVKNGPINAAKGTNVSYDIFIGNIGPDDSTMVTLRDPLPAGMTFVSMTQNSGPLFTPSGPMPGTNGTVTETIATFTAGSTADFTLVVTIAPMTPDGTTFTNIATVFSTGTPDPNPENDSSAAATTVPVPSADVAVTKVGPSTAGADTDVSFDIAVNNAGPDDAMTVSLTDTLPGTMTFVSFNQNSGLAFNCTKPPVGGSGTVTCTIATLPVNTPADFTLIGHIPPGTISGTLFNNTASVSSSSDMNPENDQSIAGVTVESTDIAIAKTGPPTALAGGSISYSVTVSNGGPDIAQQVQFNDTLPASLTFVSLIQNSGPAASCSTPVVGANGTIICAISTLDIAASAAFTINATVASTAANGSTITNTATASSQTADPNPANNTSSASTTVNTQSDLSVTKSGPASAAAGATLSYTIAVTNNGPGDASTVSLTDTIPAGTTFVSMTPPAGWSCSGTTTVTCTAATLTAGSTASFTLVVQTSAAAPSGTVISNSATVASTTTDPTPGNNTSSTVTTTLSTSADLSITKTNDVAIGALPGQNVTYTITVTNNGPSYAANVTVTDTLPPTVSFVSAAPSQGSCTSSTCTLGTLANGATATISVVVQAGTTFGLATNTATVSTSTVDPNPANNSATSTFLITPQIPAASPTALMLLAMALAAAGMLLIRRP